MGEELEDDCCHRDDHTDGVTGDGRDPYGREGSVLVTRPGSPYLWGMKRLVARGIVAIWLIAPPVLQAGAATDPPIAVLTDSVVVGGTHLPYSTITLLRPSGTVELAASRAQSIATAPNSNLVALASPTGLEIRRVFSARFGKVLARNSGQFMYTPTWNSAGTAVAVNRWTSYRFADAVLVDVISATTGARRVTIDARPLRVPPGVVCAGSRPSSLTITDWRGNRMVGVIRKYNGECWNESYSEIVTVNATTGAISRVPGSGTQASSPTMSLDGSLVMYERNGVIVITTLATGTTFPVADGRNPRWHSPSGRFSFEVGGTTIMATLGAVQQDRYSWTTLRTIPATSRRLSSGDGIGDPRPQPPFWSPDGNYLAMIEPTGVMVYPATGGAPWVAHPPGWLWLDDLSFARLA